MKITADTPDLLVTKFAHWKGSVFWGLLSLLCLWIGTFIVDDPKKSIGILLLWLGLTVLWMLPLALLLAERAMLVLNATTGEADLRTRNMFGLHRHTWPLGEVQSTRVTRVHSRGPAAEDKQRRLTLYVREGMDEGRHAIMGGALPAQDALTASARVSDWMRDWRKRQPASLDSADEQA